MQTVDFFGAQVSRLMVGGNPFSGHSYISPQRNEEMLDYYTSSRVAMALARAEALGYTACVLLSDEFNLRALREYKNNGGKLGWIAQTHPPTLLDVNLMNIMKYDPIAIFHQGTMTDNLVEAGKITQLVDNLKRIADTGKPAGLATHVPETLLRAEEEGWGADFYMACVHNLRKNKRYESSFITGKFNELTFYAEDRAAMFSAIRQTPKPCIAFKILSGGHLAQTKDSIESALRETFSSIKPIDAAVVGVFQRDKDELAENAELAAKVLKGG